jgi:hypothetical protein
MVPHSPEMAVASEAALDPTRPAVVLAAVAKKHLPERTCLSNASKNSSALLSQKRAQPTSELPRQQQKRLELERRPCREHASWPSKTRHFLKRCSTTEVPKLSVKPKPWKQQQRKRAPLRSQQRVKAQTRRGKLALLRWWPACRMSLPLNPLKRLMKLAAAAVLPLLPQLKYVVQ